MTDTVRESSSGKGEVGVREAAQALADKLEMIHESPAYQCVWSVSQVHVGPYGGPSYAEELAALTAALSTPDRARVEVLEEAAQVVLKMMEGENPWHAAQGLPTRQENIANAIRALAHTTAVSGQAEGGVK